MHKELLCNTSSYFRAALNGSFKEAKEQKIELEEEDVTTFKHFQYWLYSRTLLMTQQSENDIEWDILVDLFILGEAHGIPHLQNAAIDGLVSKQISTGWTPLHLISRIYENTPEKSPIRRLFVDWTHWKAHLNPETESEAWFDNQTYEYFNKQFLYDLSMAYCGRINALKGGRKDFTTAPAENHVSIPE